MYAFIDVCAGVNCIELLRIQTIVANIQVTHVFVKHLEGSTNQHLLPGIYKT